MTAHTDPWQIIEKSEMEQRDWLIATLTETDERILDLAEHRYGNYVLQKCIECAVPERRMMVHDGS